MKNDRFLVYIRRKRTGHLRSRDDVVHMPANVACHNFGARRGGNTADSGRLNACSGKRAAMRLMVARVMERILRYLGFTLAAGLLVPLAVASAQEEDRPRVQPQQVLPTIPSDFTLPPGEGEAAPDSVRPASQSIPVTQPLPEPTQTQAAPARERSAAPARNPARAATFAPQPAPTAAAPVASGTATPAAQTSAPSAELTPPRLPVTASQPAAPVETASEPAASGFNWLLIGLLIMVAAIVALVVFLRRQTFETAPQVVEKFVPAAPESEPALPLPLTPAPSDGMVHARSSASGMVTTNLAAKRRERAATAQPTPVRLRISFDGF